MVQREYTSSSQLPDAAGVVLEAGQPDGVQTGSATMQLSEGPYLPLPGLSHAQNDTCLRRLLELAIMCAECMPHVCTRYSSFRQYWPYHDGRELRGRT